MAINVHTGLSPHYRGRNCTEFAIINEDFENIGVTIHIVRKQIDGGEILVQRRPEIVGGDTEFSIEMKNRALGFRLFREIVERVIAGELPRPAIQPKDVGLLLLGRAFTAGHARLLRELVAGGAVERYVERKASGKIRPKPILEELQMFPAERTSAAAGTAAS
jgi:methionyl-tRNA formyltransferase